MISYKDIEKNTHNVNTIAESAIRLNMFQKIFNACHAMTLTYSLDVLRIFQILSRKTSNKSSVLEFWNRWIISSLKNPGIRLIWLMYHGNHNSVIEDSIRSNRDIKDWSNSVHRLKKNGIKIMNPDNTNIVAIIYVIKIHSHLLFVSLCQNMTTHSNASEMMNAAITIYKYDNDVYIMYQSTTTHNHNSRNLSIFFVVITDSIVLLLSSSSKWSVEISIEGVGKRFSFFEWKLNFHVLKLLLNFLKFCLDCCRKSFIFVSIEMFEKN